MSLKSRGAIIFRSMSKGSIYSILPSVAKDRPVILFDGVCNLCTGFVYFTIKRDSEGQFLFVRAQTKLGEKILKFYNQPLVNFESNILIYQDKAYFKSEAFLNVTKFLCWPWPFWRFGLIFHKGIRDWLYDRIALNRYRLFGKKEKCMVPTPQISKRFLDVK